MPSPFPGMDPYIEPFWGDVHTKLIAFIAESLNEQLPRGLRVVSEEDVSIASDDPDDPQLLRPDVTVAHSPHSPAGHATASVALADPPARSIRVRLVREPRPDRRVLILDSATGGRVVTAIEVLSPASKASASRKYLRKLATYRAGGVSCLEIDLLRHPSRDRLELDTASLPADARTPYLAVVSRAWEPDELEVVPIPLRERLPVLPVPLRRGDSEARLDLKPLIDRLYRAGRYEDVIDYRLPPDPPLSPDDAAWAAGLLAGRPAR